MSVGCQRREGLPDIGVVLRIEELVQLSNRLDLWRRLIRCNAFGLLAKLKGARLISGAQCRKKRGIERRIAEEEEKEREFGAKSE